MDMITRVFTDTGKYPAIKGFDLIQLYTSNSSKEQVDEAIEWWEGKNKIKGAATAEKLLPDKPDIHGIVTFCWHWNIDSKNNSFYSKDTTFRIPMKDGQLDKESDDFTKKIKPTLDKAAAALQPLKEKDIPVLWRPLHEAAGNWPAANPNNAWFWWGASGSEAYKALWEYMYEYFSNEKGMNNLIWVWNGQNKSWFPNPDTVDIVSFDYYVTDSSPSTPQNYNSQKDVFNRTKAMSPDGDLMVALTENGAIPDPDNCKTDNAMWLWFMVWNDRYGSTDGETHKDNFWTGEHHNTQTHKEKVYNHELVITLDELPDITKYRLE
jgi:mannan endo-1,4-beta-mannosidase